MTRPASAGTGVEIERCTVPLSPAMRQELPEFWAGIFQTSFAELDGVLAGAEATANTDTIYLAKAGGVTAATCHLTVSRLDPRLGGLGEIATHPDHRGRGLAGALVGRAVAEFEQSGGTHLLLGTVNPVAARLYETFGFRYLPRTRVMLRTADPAAAFAGWYDDASAANVDIVAGGPGHRLTIIPAILGASGSTVLDANAGLISAQVIEQTSCMGLYPRYHAVAAAGGQWFVAQRPDGAALGVTSIRRRGEGVARVDAFAGPAPAPGLLADLFSRAVDWASSERLAVEAVCHASDEDKQAILATLGLKAAEQTTLTVGNHEFPALRYSH